MEEIGFDNNNFKKKKSKNFNKKFNVDILD
jgi:hypothetical protein